MARTKSNTKLLQDVAPEYCFWCCDSNILKNLEELESALKKMKASTFKYHVNKDKNDFSNWINDIIGDEKLAKDLGKVKNKTEALKKVSARLKQLRKNK